MGIVHRQYVALLMVFRKTSAAIGLAPLALLACGAISPLSAQSVVQPDGSTVTGASTAASGRITIDIAPKTASGTSLNRYTSFNVPTAGVDLNNTTVGARTIINEVTSSNPTLIQGQLQVLGSRAHVIVANPNGITVDGGSFVNTGGVALAVGTVGFVTRAVAPGQSQDNPVITTSNGVLIVGAGGLSGAMSHLDLIARQLRIDGEVKNSTPSSNADIRVTAGNSSVEFDAGVFPTNVAAAWSATSSGGTSSPGAVLVDISRPGGLAASRVQIAVTDAGAGVRSAGRLLASAQDFTLTTTGDVHLAGTLLAGRDIVIDAAAIGVSGNDDGSASSLSSGRHMDLLASAIDIRAAALQAGTAGGDGDVTLGKAGSAATANLVIAGVQGSHGYTASSVSATGGLGLYADGRDVLIEGAALSAGGAVELTGTQVTLRSVQDQSGALQASRLNGGQTRVTASGDLTLSGFELAGSAGLTVSAAAINATAIGAGDEMHGSSFSASLGDVNLTATDAASFRASDVVAGGNIRINAATADFAAIEGASGWQGSQISAQNGGLLIKATGGDIRNSGSALQGRKAIAGEAESHGGVSLSASGAVINRSLSAQSLGLIFATEEDLSIDAGGAIENHAGRLISNRNVTLRAGGDLVNAVEKSGGSGTVTTSGRVKTGFWNRLFGGKSQSLSSVDYGSLTIPGTLAYVVANGDIALNGANLRNIGGEIDANNGSIAITTGTLTNEALTTGRASVQVTCGFTCRTTPMGTVQMQGGTMSASRDIAITASNEVLNRGGSLLALGQMEVTAPRIRAEAVTTWRAVALPGSVFSAVSPHLLRTDQGGLFRALGGLVRLSSLEPVVIQGGQVDGSTGEDMSAGALISAPVVESGTGGSRPIGIFQ